MRFRPYTIPALKKSKAKKFKLWCLQNEVTCTYLKKNVSLSYIFDNFLIKSNNTKFYQKKYTIELKDLLTLFENPNVDCFYVSKIKPFDTSKITDIESLSFDYHDLKAALGKPLLDSKEWFIQVNDFKMWIFKDCDEWWVSTSDAYAYSSLCQYISSCIQDTNCITECLEKIEF
jgi:hypothetical protein